MKIRIHWRTITAAHARRAVRLLEAMFFTAGGLMLAWCAWSYFEAGWFQASEIGRFVQPETLSDAFDGQQARADLTVKLSRALPAVPESAPRRGAAFSKIEIPRLGVEVVVVEGVEPKNLKLGAGHIPGTALPGEPGNIAIAAHRDTFFRELRHIQEHDRITLTTLHGAYNYSVEETEIVDPSAVDVLAPTDEQTLTLITCYPFSWIGSAPQRFIVQAQAN